ncbi:MAG: tetratricopeptide repeat protein, partial [Pyrinomonadaceae bacterium]
VKLCANYSVQPVESLDFSSFFMPLILSAFILLLMALVARKSSLQKIGLMLFLLPLIPAMNASFFPRDNIVHDRYLYLPLLGFLMLILPELKNFVLRFETPAIVGKPERIGVGLLMLITLLLSLKTISYNQVWLDDLSVWEHAVRTDSGSASSWVQYGAELLERNRFEEAEQAYNRAIEIKPSTLALLGRGRSLIGQKKFDSAVEDLKKIIEKPTDELDLYQLFQSYEAIAIAYTEKGEPEKALEVLLQARKRLPIYYASLTVKTAIVLYQLNRKQEVLQELETVKERAKRELMPESKSVFFRLGLLYAEMGRKTEARANLQEFLRFSTSFKNKVTVREREIALEYLNKLK